MTGQRQSAARQQTVSSGSFQFKYFHFNSNIFNYNSPDEFICVDNGGKSCCVVGEKGGRLGGCGIKSLEANFEGMTVCKLEYKDYSHPCLTAAPRTVLQLAKLPHSPHPPLVFPIQIQAVLLPTI